MNKTVTVKHEVLIAANKEAVWNFTQDFERRMLWDKTVLGYSILQKKPFKIVRIKTLGFVITDLKYKLCRRFEKTSLQMTNTRSMLFGGGGGSWNYESTDGGTRWTQTNSLTFKNRLLFFFFAGLIKAHLSYSTRKSMKTARQFLEN